MYVRLAFAVAAHLDPEILIVDEVLAVGDAEFQKKCLSKMYDVSEKEGRTVLFVSHNLQAIKNLCQKTAIINNGELLTCGPTSETIDFYHKLIREIKIDENTDINDKLHRRGKGVIRFTGIEVTDIKGNKKFNFEIGESIRFKITYEVYKEMKGITVIIALLSGLSRECLTLAKYELTDKNLSPGAKGEAEIEFMHVYIKPGEYPLYFELIDNEMNGYTKDVLDDLTAPLTITGGKNKEDSDFQADKPSGFFAIPSKMVSNELDTSNKYKEAL